MCGERYCQFPYQKSRHICVTMLLGDRQEVRCAQTEKAHAGFSASRYVRADVQLRKRGQHRQRRCRAQTHATHAERHDADPSLALERIEFQRARDQWAEHRGLDRPMREEQIVPGLRQDPAPWRQGPRPVLDIFGHGFHAILGDHSWRPPPIYPFPRMRNRIGSFQHDETFEGENKCNAEHRRSGRAG